MSKTTLIDCRRNTLIGKYHKCIRNYSNSAKYCIQSDSSECEILCQKSLPCVSTPADFILVFRTLLNRFDCIILTHGDGVEGSVVTHNALFFKGLPLHIPYKERLVVRNVKL